MVTWQVLCGWHKYHGTTVTWGFTGIIDACCGISAWSWWGFCVASTLNESRAINRNWLSSISLFVLSMHCAVILSSSNFPALCNIQWVCVGCLHWVLRFLPSLVRMVKLVWSTNPEWLATLLFRSKMRKFCESKVTGEELKAAICWEITVWFHYTVNKLEVPSSPISN